MVISGHVLKLFHCGFVRNYAIVPDGRRLIVWYLL